MAKWNKWTDKECDFLKENIGTYSMAYIAKSLGRTETAVLVKAKRLNLGCFKNNSDKNRIGTSEYVSEAIKIYCKK